ncbi:MAG: hypothetical protein DRI90_28485 [Deltaproteobacteria bacterium]|nr:MAG: hypothetical protein DRI90_28485 [Deltaproteobacteria bacterium]
MCPVAPPSSLIQHWRIDRLWNGDAAQPGEVVVVDFARHDQCLSLHVDAPFHGDPPPILEAGPVDRLWEHEVVELFLLAEPDRYLEIELGPHGHYWVLKLVGRRRVRQAGLPIHYQAEIEGHRWHGRGELPWAYLPEGACRGNAYAIHGEGLQRRHLAYYPVPGPVPDFHRLEHFGPLGSDEDS